MLKKLFSAIKSHKIISGIIIIALGAAGYFIFGTGSKSSVGTTYTYGTATAGTVMQTVSGTGQIEASRQTDITSEVSGDVTGVAVTAGRAVKAGDTIAKIDSSDAQAAIDDAKIALYNAQVSLDNILNPDDSLSITQAKNSVLDAQKTLENDQSGLNDSYQTGFSSVAATFNQLPTIVASLQEIVASANNYVVQSSPTYLDYYYNAVKKYDSTAGSLMTKAASSYQDAKLKYDANFQDYKSASQFSSEANIEALIDETYATSKAVADALKNISSMIQNYESNLKNHNLTPQSFADTQLTNLGSYTTTANSYVANLLSASQAIDNAKYSIESDQRSLGEKNQTLADLQAAPDKTDVQSAQYAVQQKQRALDDARKELENYTITAPFDGTVATVDVGKGDKVSANTAIATVITDNQIVTVSLNEVDIAKVKVGQQATLTFDAISDLTMTGKVAEVATVGTVSSGVVNYDVTIALDSGNSQIKPGMSTSVTIVANIAQDVLTVPSAAVKTADDGTYYVLVPAATENTESVQTTKKTVTVGLSDDTSIEIKSGLNEGDQVVVSTSKSSTTTKKTTGSSGSLFNIGGGGVRRGD